MVNLGGRTAAGQVRFPLDGLPERQWRLVDRTHGVWFDRSGLDMTEGL